MGTTQLKLADFLRRMKELAKARKNIFFVPRKKNEESLLRLNLTVPMVYQELIELTPSNYYVGPKEDRDGSVGEVWVFRHPVSGVEIYIKMKLFQVQGEDYLKILSFHQWNK